MKIICRTMTCLVLLASAGSTLAGNQEIFSQSVKDAKVHDSEKKVQDAVQLYLDGMRTVADQMSEDAENQSGISNRTREKTEAVKLYTAYTQAYTEYATVLNKFATNLLANPFDRSGFSLEDMLVDAVSRGAIIQDVSRIKMPELFRHYIQAREELLTEVVQSGN